MCASLGIKHSIYYDIHIGFSFPFWKLRPLWLPVRQFSTQDWKHDHVFEINIYVAFFFLMVHAEVGASYKYKALKILNSYPSTLWDLWKHVQTCVLIPVKKCFSSEMFFKVEHSLRQIKILMCFMFQPGPTIIRVIISIQFWDKMIPNSDIPWNELFYHELKERSQREIKELKTYTEFRFCF